jgi:maltose alpha-D-glucosyltransferase / alpha-amylase
VTTGCTSATRRVATDGAQKDRRTVIGDLWYKNAIIYSIDVETFMDGNGDGVGDFRGLRSRLEYLASLGVTCLWLLPFYPTPNRDNGYDVSDYYGVDPRLGDLGDFVAFSKEAEMHGLRIIVDLVANHTSDQHPWFQKARSDPSSRYRDYYIWSQTKPENAEEGLVFPGDQKSTWTYDETAGAYYFHRFYHFQPDLNVHNPDVREEILKIMGYWLELGVSGFRVDAVPFLIERHGASENDPAHDLLTQMREFMSWRRGDAVMLAEANVGMDELKEYFAGGTRIQLAFNFVANQALFLALARGDAAPLRHALGETLHLESRAQWASFLRNHDELDLARLSDEERQFVFSKFGPDPDMQLYERGLRRRLAPMLDGDPARLALAYSLLFTLPGAPVLWYGEEIGMGELLTLEGRQSVRTPMQWSHGHNGGFSTSATLVRPLVTEGPYAFGCVNVAGQRHDPRSLLRTIVHMIHARRECPEIAWGEWKVLDELPSRTLGLSYAWRDTSLIVLHNFTDERSDFTVASPDRRAVHWSNVLTGAQHTSDARGALGISLEPYGFVWLRGVGEAVAQSEQPATEFEPT